MQQSNNSKPQIPAYGNFFKFYTANSDNMSRALSRLCTPRLCKHCKEQTYTYLSYRVQGHLIVHETDPICYWCWMQHEVEPNHVPQFSIVPLYQKALGKLVPFARG